MSRVSYEKSQKERAIAEKKWLVTVAVDGKHLGDQSMVIQALVDLPKAQEICLIGMKLLKRKGN